MSKAVDQSLLAKVVKKLGPKRAFEALDADQRLMLPFMWRIVGRPKQFAPERAWRWWLIDAGRGFGKTRSGAEWVREKVKRMPGCRVAIVGQTPAEAEKIQLYGDSGLMTITPKGERPEYFKTDGILRWPNGAIGEIHSAAEPDKMRGPQFHIMWLDEFAKFRKAAALYDNAQMALRLEYHGLEKTPPDPRDIEPQGIITTTPRPIKKLLEIQKKTSTAHTNGSTYENKANLAKSFLSEMREAYEGTRIGRQELHGETLDDVPGALWQRAWFDREGFRVKADLKSFDFIVVALDPAASNTETSDESGIVVVGMKFLDDGRKRYHVLADRSIYGSPSERCRAAIAAMNEFEADHFVVEVNNGGDWISATLQAEWSQMQMVGAAPIETVSASRGKHTRAEPISALYEQPGMTITHEAGADLEALEDQMVTWSPLLGEKSPDRMDALVWAITDLSNPEKKRVVFV